MVSSINISSFRSKLLRWFSENRRNYPWRHTSDPYQIVIAEMMLQRTKADQVKKVYETFISEYPTLKDLVIADDREVYHSLKSLGLKWRYSNFKSMANEVKEKYGGKVPDSCDELKKISGIGPYIAGAVVSQAFDRQEAAVDSNVARIFTRYFDIPIRNEQRRNPKVISIAMKYSKCKTPGDANMALVDFAALVCLPNKPKCTECILSAKCCYIRNRREKMF